MAGWGDGARFQVSPLRAAGDQFCTISPSISKTGVPIGVPCYSIQEVEFWLGNSNWLLGLVA